MPKCVPSLGDSIEGAAPVAIGAGGEIEDHMKVQLLVRASRGMHRVLVLCVRELDQPRSGREDAEVRQD
jgi:hypothetical protein